MSNKWHLLLDEDVDLGEETTAQLVASVDNKLIDGTGLESKETLIATGSKLQIRLSLRNTSLVSGLDKVLKGGLKQGRVTEIYGSGSTGKTQICHSSNTQNASPDAYFILVLVCAAFLRRRKRVIYVDTTNSFHPERVVEYATDNIERQRLESVDVYRLHDVYQLRQLIDELADKERESSGLALIVDSISAALSSVCNYDSSQSYALVDDVGKALRRLAEVTGMVVLLTNHEVGSGRYGDRVQPALGLVWKNQVHVRVHLSQHDITWRKIGIDDNTTADEAYIRITRSGIVTKRM